MRRVAVKLTADSVSRDDREVWLPLRPQAGERAFSATGDANENVTAWNEKCFSHGGALGIRERPEPGFSVTN